MNFADRLDAQVREKGSPCLLGLDPHLALLPEEFSVAADPSAPRGDRASAVADFLCELTDLCVDRVAVVKPQSAFFELLGADGAVAWERVARQTLRTIWWFRGANASAHVSQAEA